MCSYDMSHSSAAALRWMLESLVGTKAFRLHREDPIIMRRASIEEDSGWGSSNTYLHNWDQQEAAEPNPDILIAHVVTDELCFQAITSTGLHVNSATHIEHPGLSDATIKEHAIRLMDKIKRKCLESIQKVFSSFHRQSNVTYSLLLCPHFTTPPAAAIMGGILVQEAEKNNARMLIIASHGPVGGMCHIGSISRHVWHQSLRIPVLLIPPHSPPSENNKVSAVVSQPDIVVIVEDENQLRECSQFVAECLVRVGDSVHVWFIGQVDKQPVPQTLPLDIETSIISQSSCEGVYSKGFSSSSSVSASAMKSPHGLFAIYEQDNGKEVSRTSLSSAEETISGSAIASLPETVSSLLGHYRSIRLVAVYDPCGGGESRSIKCELTKGEMVRHLVKNCPIPLVLIPPSMQKAPLNDQEDEDEEFMPLMTSSASEDFSEDEEMARNY